VTKDDFVKGIKIAVRDSAITGTLDSLGEPPGRHPSKEAQSISKWYNRLSKPDQKRIQLVVEMAVDSTLFGFFCVLDGVRVIEDGEHKGELELYYLNNSKSLRTLLNDFNEGEFLHDLYNDITTHRDSEN